MALEGKIVTTDISCTTSLGSLQICLIFKVEGTINCKLQVTIVSYNALL